LAALLGARLLQYFRQATHIDTTKAILWTDSTVTLGWIRQDPNRWNTFECNWVTEIQTYTTPSQWRHCPGKDNLADILSRGVTADQLEASDMVEWTFLAWATSEVLAPEHTFDVSLPEMKGSTHHILSVEIPPRVVDPTKYSSYWKLLRVTAWIFRVRQIALQRERPYGELVALELHAAQSYWIQVVQRENFLVELKALHKNLPLPDGSKIARFIPFLDEGFICLDGRL
jgi:hypothetical protein